MWMNCSQLFPQNCGDFFPKVFPSLLQVKEQTSTFKASLLAIANDMKAFGAGSRGPLFQRFFVLTPLNDDITSTVMKRSIAIGSGSRNNFHSDVIGPGKCPDDKGQVDSVFRVGAFSLLFLSYSVDTFLSFSSLLVI